MSLILQGPLPNPTTTLMLPSPQFSDSQALSLTIDVKQSMNGKLYSYVKSNARSKLQYSLTLSRMEALALRAFILSYYRAKVRLTNHKGEVWDVNFTSNPFEFTSKSKSSAPGGTTIEITLEFEGVLVTPVSDPEC
jgi:hypothetical protein